MAKSRRKFSLKQKAKFVSMYDELEDRAHMAWLKKHRFSYAAIKRWRKEVEASGMVLTSPAAPEDIADVERLPGNSLTLADAIQFLEGKIAVLHEVLSDLRRLQKL